MRVLLIGIGGVGGAIAAITARRTFVELLVVADVDPLRAEGVAAGASGLLPVPRPQDEQLVAILRADD